MSRQRGHRFADKNMRHLSKREPRIETAGRLRDARPLNSQVSG
jgi:hypothetical protein